MNLKCYSMIALIGTALIFQGCGEQEIKEHKAQTTDQSRQIAKLQSELSRAGDDLSRARGELSQAGATLARREREIGELSDKVRSLEAEANKRTAMERGLADRGKTVDGPPASGRGGDTQTDRSRIGLIGAKALAEFKAAKLSKRLDELKEDLDRKETALKEIAENARTKDDEIAALRERIEELQASEQTRTAELRARLQEIEKQLKERSAEAQRHKNELDEKQGLLDALKGAASDAGRLKAAAESRVKELEARVADLQAQLTKAAGDAERAGQQIADLQAQSEASRKEIVRVQGVAEKENARVQGLAEQTAKEKDYYQTEATKLRLEVERQQKEAEEQRAAIADLGSRLEAAEASQREAEAARDAAEAPPEPARAEPAKEEGPSAIDRLLQPPVEGKSEKPTTTLY